MTQGAGDLEVRTRDGRILAATLHRAPQRNARDCAVIVNSAIGVERRFYAPFAAYLAQRGFDALTYDYRGVGGSAASLLHDPDVRMADWGERDFASVIDHARHELGRRGVAVVGHSAGGQILGLADNNAHVSAVLLVAAQGGYWKHWTGFARARMAFYMFVLLPAAVDLLGYAPRALLGADVPGAVIREWMQWCRTENYLLGGAGDARRPGFQRVRAPLLALSFSDDFYAPATAVDWLVQQYASTTVTRRHITRQDLAARRVDHFAFFRPAARETLWHYAATWLEAQTP
jgi:predicted alpha/beta hydrolase